MGKLNKRFKLILFIVITLFFTAVYSIYAVEWEIIEGYLICVALDNKGNLETKVEYNDCSGIVALVDRDEQIYTISGSQSDLDKLYKTPKRRLGVLMEQNLRGKVYGHKRALQLMIGSEKYVDDTKIVKKKGTIYCLLPHYKKTNINYMVSNKPCFLYAPHAHIFYTKDGEIMAINGSKELVREFENSSQRVGVYLAGSISGSEKGKYIYLK